MIGVSWQIEEPMEIGKLNKRSLYVDGAEGIGALAESFGRQHDMQVHVILNPQQERARFVTPLSPSQIQEGLHHVYKANETLCRNMDTNVLSSGDLQKIQWIVQDAQTVITFVLLKTEGFTNQYYKEKQDGVYKWLWMHKTKPFTCTMKVANSGTPYHG